MDGMNKPETISLRDDRAGAAARPYAVRQETARERTRTLLEELRNRELKANEAQLGKDAIDAFGKRVRLEEYLLRPSDSEFKLLFLSRRAGDSLNWGSLDEQFHAAIPDDISKVGDIIDGMYFSKTAPANWMTNFEVYLTNTVDSIKETIDFGAPTLVNFSGYGLGSRYYPSTMDWKQTLSGPGVPGGERVQFDQLMDYNATTPGQFTWKQYVVDASGNAASPLTASTYMYGLTLDPTSPTDIANLGSEIPGSYNSAIDPDVITPTYNSYPSGPGKADLFAYSVYADGSSLSSRKMLVSNEGDILGIPGSASSGLFLKEGSYNLEMVVGSSLFQGRNIDVLLAPEILSQKNTAISQPNASNAK
jgi:hypothetical protein